MAEVVSRDVRVDWPAIFAGAVVATAIGLVLSTFGIAIGLSVTSPYEGEGVSPAMFAFGAGLWVLAIQVLAFWMGGYVCARLRARQPELTEHEVDVRDGLHGFLVWGTGVIAAAFIAFAGLAGATSAAETASPGSIVASAATAATAEVDQAASRERADNPQASDETVTERKAEIARKLTVISAFITAASLLVGAAAAFFAAGVGGQHRDKSMQVRFFTIRRVPVAPPPPPVA